MKRGLFIAVVGIVVAANVGAWLLTALNRSSTPGGTVVLTERELQLPSRSGESTALFLRLQWDTDTPSPHRWGEARWLDANKLTELGFDCTMPATRPEARDYYHSLPAKLVFMVLEYEGNAWRQSDPERKRTTRLFVIDAGIKAGSLRKQYPDQAQYILARGLIRPELREPRVENSTAPSEPQLLGRIDQIIPDRIFVPAPHNQVLFNLPDRSRSTQAVEPEEPRFKVAVSWGRLYEPWITRVQLLPGTPSSP